MLKADFLSPSLRNSCSYLTFYSIIYMSLEKVKQKKG